MLICEDLVASLGQSGLQAHRFGRIDAYSTPNASPLVGCSNRNRDAGPIRRLHRAVETAQFQSGNHRDAWIAGYCLTLSGICTSIEIAFRHCHRRQMPYTRCRGSLAPCCLKLPCSAAGGQISQRVILVIQCVDAQVRGRQKTAATVARRRSHQPGIAQPTGEQVVAAGMRQHLQAS